MGSLTDRPLTVILTHAHHDHALGARWFDAVYLFPQDMDIYPVYTGKQRRQNVLESARARGVRMDERKFMHAVLPTPSPLEEGVVDLGGLRAQIILCPGHTPGSAVVYVPERKLLLTGDDWNPCTWLFFREALTVQTYRENVRRLLALPFRHLLCPHRTELFDRFMLEDFVEGLRDEALLRTKDVPTGDVEGVHTVEIALPYHQVLVFDQDKFALERAKEAR